MPSPSLLKVAELTFSKSPAREGSVNNWLVYLYNLREKVHVIVKDDELLGMIIAEVKEGTLIVYEMITLEAGCFAEFVSRAFELFGPFEKLTYHRRGKLKTISYKRLKELTL